MIQLHKILIGIVLMSVMVAGIGMFYSSGVATYSPTGYNETSLQPFLDSMDDISGNMNETKADLEDVGAGSTGITDILGGIFQSGYTAVKTAVQGVNTMFGVVNAGVGALPIGGFAKPLIGALTVIILIVIFVGIMFHKITKSDRT